MAQRVKNLPAVRETGVQSLAQKDPLEKGMATHSSILAWRISWTEEPCGLQSMGSQRVGHDWMTNTSISPVTAGEAYQFCKPSRVLWAYCWASKVLCVYSKCIHGEWVKNTWVVWFHVSPIWPNFFPIQIHSWTLYLIKPTVPQEETKYNHILSSGTS